MTKVRTASASTRASAMTQSHSNAHQAEERSRRGCGAAATSVGVCATRRGYRTTITHRPSGAACDDPLDDAEPRERPEDQHRLADDVAAGHGAPHTRVA